MEAHLHPAAGQVSRHAAIPLRLAGDERLARLVGSGSEAAFSTLYARFHQPLYRYCRSLVGNDADAQDALQTALTRALVALRDGRRDAPLRPWLFRIAHNESISLLRRRRPEQELSDDPGATAPSPHEVAEQRARLGTLLADLRELPERQRGALVMREMSGLSHEEIAQALGISVGAAKQTVLEARRSLQEFSQGRGMSCEEIQRIVSDGDRRALRGRRVRAHLRDCAGCAAFAEAIPARRRDLLALAPALPPAAAARLLARVTGGGSGHGGGGVGMTAGATGKGFGAAMSAKTLAAGAAVLTTAAVGAGTLHHLVAHRQAPPATVATRARAATSPPATARRARPGTPALARARGAGAAASVHGGPGVRGRGQPLHARGTAHSRLSPSARGRRRAGTAQSGPLPAGHGATSTAPGQSRGASAPGHAYSASGSTPPGHAHGRTGTTPPGRARGRSRTGSTGPGHSASHRSGNSASSSQSGSATTHPAGHHRPSSANSASAPAQGQGQGQGSGSSSPPAAGSTAGAPGATGLQTIAGAGLGGGGAGSSQGGSGKIPK